MRFTVQLSDPRIMAQNQNHLIWIDMEMTGLNPDTDRVIEVALVITDGNLETIAEAPVLVVHQPDSVLDGMDAWNKSTHGKSGLIDKVKASTLDEATVEAQMVEFLREYVPSRTSPMCGNSICQDRRFLARWMPKFEEYFHYRNLDVSTFEAGLDRPLFLIAGAAVAWSLGTCDRVGGRRAGEDD